MERLLVKPHEAAEMLGISRSAVYSMLARGELAAVEVGGSRRIPVKDLRKLVAERAEAGGARRQEPVAAEDGD